MSCKSRSMKNQTWLRVPARGHTPSDRISGRDVMMSGEELHIFRQHFHPLFQRRKQREQSWLYLCGQLSDLERRTIEPMVLKLIGPGLNAIRRMQQFIGQGEWDAGPLITRAQSMVGAWLGEDNGVVIVDGSGFHKEGRNSAGVRSPILWALGKDRQLSAGGVPGVCQ